MSTARPWSLADMPSLLGRRALVTGVTSGIGTQTARELARAGAEIVLAARHPARLESTYAELSTELPHAVLRPVLLDLADQSSVRRAAAEAAAFGPLDLVVNNAGVMAPPDQRTVDGFELQLATNHLGPFALTGLLLDALVASGGARVVTVSSLAARSVRTVSTGDPRAPGRRYRKWSAYGETKLANLLFTVELDRRAAEHGLSIRALAAHPGYTATNLVHGVNAGRRRVDGTISEAVTALVGQSPQLGALPTLMAATDPDLPGGSYAGPSGPLQVHGPPRLVPLPRTVGDLQLAARLWAMSEQATGVRYP